ncbi:MAG: HAMP domain-containing histidine kinase, partial [Chlorobi bacterium]|nr:HAMP domain-containing histidine kinase [Chlorobiota bacterium]
MKYFLISLETGIERISKIVKGLTKFSSNQDNYDIDCNIHKIIDNCLLMLNNQLNDKITIERLFSSDNANVKCNEGDLHQVFINVFLNAIQSISEKGKIKITTKIVNGNVEVKISDTGSGIKPEYLKKVLDPFFTTKDPGKGTGLGLSIVYTIIKEHEGDIKINSEENIGTSVIIKLPVKN